MTKADLIYEIDQLVYDFQLNGIPEKDIHEAMLEYLEMIDDLKYAAPI